MPSKFYTETGNINKIGEQAKEIFQFIISPELQSELFPLKVLFIFISLGFIAIIGYFLYTTSWLDWKFLRYLKTFLFERFFGRKKVIKKWEEIKKILEKDTEAEWKIGIIQASILFDEVLGQMGYKGANIEERLVKLTSEDIPNLEQLLEAIKVCQDASRDPDYSLDKEKVEQVLDVFEETLKEWQMI